ncbi:MAG: hypothetical protein AAFR15_05295 [Cyanobacteria bacterium J06627_15]
MKLVHSNSPSIAQKGWRSQSPAALKALPKTRFKFTRIVDTQTPIPGCPGQFSRLGLGAIAPGRIVFFGGNEYGYSGIYHADGSGIKVVADSQKSVLQGSYRFASFGSSPEFDDNNIIFLAQDTSGQIRLYQDTHYRLTPLVETEQQVLGDRFINIGNPAARGGYLTFLARLQSTGNKGLFLHHDGQTDGVAYQRLAGPLLQDIAGADVSATGTVVFRGQDREYRMGIYRYRHQQVTPIATTHTLIPGGTGAFTALSNPTIEGDVVTFIGRGSLMQQGIYQIGPNGIQAVVDVHTRMPVSLELFSHFQSFATCERRTVFLAGAAHGCFGLYLTEQQQLVKVIEIGDALDNARVVGLHLGRRSLDAQGLVFKAQFEDGSCGLFRADG